MSVLQTYWQGHSTLVHDHHDHEDKLFTPMIKTRCEYPEKLEADHDELVALMEEIAGIVDELSAGMTTSALLDKFLKYKAIMEPHLTEEEQTVVPILRAFFDQREVAAKIQPMMQQMDPLLMGAFVHHQGGKAEFTKFMRQEGIPSFVWHVHFKSARAKYRAKMETQIQSLLEGKPASKPLTTKADLQLAMNCGDRSWMCPFRSHLDWRTMAFPGTSGAFLE